MSYRNVDASALYPAESSDTLREGSFLGGTPEAIFTKAFWVVRRWRIRLTADLIWQPESDVGSQIVVFPAGVWALVDAGSHNQLMTGAYVDEDDLLCNFRPSQNEETYEPSVGYVLLEFREPLHYTLDRTEGETPTDGDGFFDSRVRFACAATDIIGILGSEYGAATGSGGFFLVGTGLVLEVELDGEVINSVALWMDDKTDLPDRQWLCAGRIIVEPDDSTDSFWRWTIDDEDTWDHQTGEQLLDPLRVGSNGFQRIFLAQPPVAA